MDGPGVSPEGLDTKKANKLTEQCCKGNSTKIMVCSFKFPALVSLHLSEQCKQNKLVQLVSLSYRPQLQ